MVRRLIAAIFLGALVASSFALSGCASTTRQTEVVEEKPVAAEDTTATLTPLERGKVRRDILRAAKPAMAAFLADDEAGFKKYWDEAYVDLFADKRADYAKKGIERVRKHDVKMMDVVDMNEAGTEALVQYRFVEQSYFKDSSGKAAAPASNKETEIQLTMVKTKNGWIVQRMIAGDEVYQ